MLERVRYGLSVVTPPTVEPVDLSEAKNHTRVYHAEEDSYIEGRIEPARRWCENYTRRAFIHTTLDLFLDEFPSGPIELPRPPLSSVTSVSYVDQNGVTQTWSSSLYVVDSASLLPVIVPAYGERYPTTRTQRNAVTVRYVAGYGAAGSSVPADIRHAILMLVAQMCEHREPEVTGTIVSQVRFAVESLLGPYRVLGAGT